MVFIRGCLAGFAILNAWKDTGWLNFPQCGEKEDVAEISIKEEDLKLVKILDAKANEQIKAQFDSTNETTKGITGKSDDISGYMI